MFKWIFWNKPFDKFSGTPVSRPKSVWKPCKFYDSFKYFWVVEKQLFSDGINVSTQCNLSEKERKSLGNFAPESSDVIKSTDKVFPVLVYERNSYLHATELLENYGLLMMLLNLTKIFSLVERSNKAFKGLCSRFIMSLIIFI